MQSIARLREKQGWRGQILASTVGDRKQLCEVHAIAPSVLTVDFDITGTPLIDDAGTITVETRVDEASRVQTFASRVQGVALPVPAGITRVFCDGFQKPFAVGIQLAPGVAVTQHTQHNLFHLAALGTRVEASPRYARTLQVTCLSGAITVTANGVTWAQAAAGPTRFALVPAYGSFTVTDTAGGSDVSMVWEVTA